MKIAFDAKRFYHNKSGLGNYSRDLVRIIHYYFPNIELYLLAKKESDFGKILTNNTGIKFESIGNGSLNRLFKLGKIAQTLNADILHGLSGELPIMWNNKSIKKIVTIHDLIFERYPEYYSYIDRKIHFWKFKKAAETADIVIAISLQTKMDIIKYLKIPESKIRILYQGCHQAFKISYSDEEKKNIQEKFNLPNRFVLNVGTIEERKNLLNVVKALKNNQIPIVCVGKKTKYWKKIQNFKEKEKDTNLLLHLENVSMQELAIIYQLADIFVYPSRFEGFGIPIIEALFSKTPVITGNNSCLPEAAGPNSLYVNIESCEDIRAKIHFLWNNPSERIIRSEKSFEFVKKFTDENIAKNLFQIYSEVLSK